jgi:hypothetical protein
MEYSSWSEPDQEGRNMVDATTRKPLRVSTDGTVGPYIMVPIIQLDELREILDRHRIRYSVEEDVISLNGEPEVGVVDLGLGADPAAVQAILDGAAEAD